MTIITDDIDFSGKYFQSTVEWESPDQSKHNNVNNLLAEIFDESANLRISKKGGLTSDFWRYLLITEWAEKSQYDSLIKFAQKKDIPGSILCLAGSGGKFHGFRNREWVSLSGNIHLSAYLKPNKEIEKFWVGFLILSAVSVIMAIDDIPGLENKSSVKWVNDIIIDGAKVAGVLAFTMAKGAEVTDAIIGIGLNVQSSPNVEPNPYVPKSACLNDFLGDKVGERFVLERLLYHIEQNYKILLDGDYMRLLNFYRKRSLATGKSAIIMTDDPVGSSVEYHRGVITEIGDNLELYFNNREKAITHGRLILE